MQDRSPWDIFENFLRPEMIKLIQKETNRYAMQQINRMNQEGPLKPKSVFAQCNTVSLQEIKKLLLIIIHITILHQVISAGLLELASEYSYAICSFCWYVSG
jgi:hypothetical protein